MERLLILKTLFATTLGCAMGFSYAGQIVTKSIQVEGEGTNRKEAIESALNEAIAQVSGIRIDTKTQASNRMETHSLNDNKTMEGHDLTTTSSTVASQTKTEVKGHVKSYSVVSQNPTEDNRVKVVVDADVTLYKGGQSSDNRLKIGVLPFRGKITVPQVIDYDQRLRQSINDYLTATRYFAVIDNDFKNIRDAELDKLTAPDVPLEERAKLGNSLQSDYILVGQINKFDLKPQTSTDPYLKEKTTAYRGNVSWTWRLIETATGQVIASGSQDEKLKLKSLDDVFQHGVIDGQKIGAKMTQSIYPIMVLDNNGSLLTLSQGGETMKVGSRYNLVKFGKALTSPMTGEPMGRDEFIVGQVEISDVSPKMSHAKIIKLTGDLTELAPREYILRPIDPAPVPKVKKSIGPKW